MISSSPTHFDLALIVPVFNEEACLTSVLNEWKAAISTTVPNYVIIVIDDGSTDATPARLQALNWPELRIHRHLNRGHGQSCLVGYQLAADLGASYVFQIDSDGQCDPAAFARIWNRRAEALAIYGRRRNRDDGKARQVISFVLKCMLKFSWRTRLNDANVPYRLYKTEAVAKTATRVPSTFDLANIGIALLMEPLGFIEEPIPFRDRLGGHPSVRWMGFAKKAKRLVRDLKDLRRVSAL